MAIRFDAFFHQFRERIELEPVKRAQFVVHQGHVLQVPKTEQGADEEDGDQEESLVLGGVRTLHHTTAIN